LGDLRRDSGLTVVVISHDAVGMESLCPRTLHLRYGTLQSASASTAGGVA
ncbi:MAG: energy-coupling factor transport system ATP-binding protein, partial [Mycobacterium sp.]|nr:energy-coupling factor transport system ATP-binding protein [Mycobacterium sp.]